MKISDNEIQWLTGEESYTKGVEKIRREFSIPLILVSMGRDGSRAYYQKDEEEGETGMTLGEKAAAKLIVSRQSVREFI